ncbi:hypothetical protein KXR53_13860 [Inquilinus limosus]|uniref:hypothetical protein n=1 Tax=Inquilinus limosus TaxID=171674 RepID=UPI003F155FD4
MAFEIDSSVLFPRHGEARSAVAIQGPVRAALDGRAPSGLAMTGQYFKLLE